MDFLPESLEKQGLIHTVRQLADEHLIELADTYDRETRFPRESMDLLAKAGLLAPNVAEEYGGLGLGHHRGDVYTLWLMIVEIARADMSLSRCWEGHINALTLLDNIANPTQKEQWFDGVVNRGELWAVWSGEPLSRALNEQSHIGTSVTQVDGGYRINGSKVFCSSAPEATWAILLVNTEGRGGARHATGGAENVIMLACDLRDPSITIDPSWWDPTGMRGSVSFRTVYHDTFIPESNRIGYPGQFLLEEWQTRFTPQYAANYLGGAMAAKDYTLQYIERQEKGHDPYLHHRTGKMALNIESAHLWLRHTANFWESGQEEQAKAAGIRTRYLVEQLAADTIEHAIHACGARALNKPSSLERINRDFAFYARHDNDDHVLATIGKSVLGRGSDASFFRPDQKSTSKNPSKYAKE